MRFPFAIVVVSCLANALPGQRNDLAEPLVSIVADGARGDALEKMVAEAGMRRRRTATADCVPSLLRQADVVIVDWPEGTDLGATPPLGELERWDRPTVFFGGCGARFAKSWGLPGPDEIASMATADLGPEMEQVKPPEGASTVVWRQGHLLHFVCAAAPADLAAAERDWLLRSLRYAARFVTDRPIVRHPTANGALLPEVEQQRRARIDAAAKLLEVDVRDPKAVFALPERFAAGAADAGTLLVDLIADGPGEHTTSNNWKNWLRARSQKLVWDDLSRVWRLDPVPYWRGMPRRGADRADGGVRDGDSLALCTKIVQRYGGRAFDDLTTFTCWHGSVHITWDRRNGWFRVENHAVVPPGNFGTQWEVAVLDTAADRELIWGGGPPPKPRVSARGAFRETVIRVFLPAMLLDPGVFVARRPESDSGKLEALVVRPGLRGLDADTEYVLLADHDSGEIARVEEYSNGKLDSSCTLAATASCGPMELPTSWTGQVRRRQLDYKIEEPAWNPDLPPDIATATERLTSPRER